MNIDVLSNIQALAFDVGGSVFDWKSAVRCGIETIAGDRGINVDSESFAMQWRGRMFERLQAVRTGKAPWANADTLHRQALDDLSDRYVMLRLSEEDKDELNLVWHRMPAWADVSPALLRLRDRYVCVVLTLLSLKIVIDSSRLNGISWDGIISCEFLGQYKPHPEAYRAGCRLLGLTPQEVMMVAAHSGDLRAARSAGLRTAFVEPKLNEPAETGDNSLPEQGEFDFVAADYEKLADLLCGKPA